MWAITTLIALLALAPFPSLSLTVSLPTANSSPRLSPRRGQQHCYNGPTTVPGTTFTTRPDVEPELPTSDTIIWCAPNTQTYITLLYARPLPGGHAWGTIQHVVDAAFAATRKEIHTGGGDRIIIFGEWTYQDLGVEVFFQNTNNHQQTWGVVGSALVALEGYMQMIQTAGGQPGALIFDVFDGKNQVGNGTFGVGS